MAPLRTTRRETLIRSGLGLAGTLGLAGAKPVSPRQVTPGPRAQRASLRFGVITDVHQDIMHDGIERISSFVTAMKSQDVDFVIQLGDFCQPKEANDAFMEAWRHFEGPRYHVIGNHEMDGGFSRDQVVEYFGMPSRYYSFDAKGLHVIVLDGNDPGGKLNGYARFIAQDQVDWLTADLAANPLPTVVFVHQPLDSPDGVENREEIRRILGAAGQQDGHPGVVGVFSGHSHVDYSRLLDGIYYTLINSASYVWVGGKNSHQSYGPEVHEKHDVIERTCPYRDPLWAVISIDLASGTMEINGTSSSWVGPDPVACGADWKEGYWGWNPKYAVPRVSSWRVPLRSEGEIGSN